MAAYRCSVCNINYSSPRQCENCGGTVWWSMSSNPSSEEEKKQAELERMKKHAEEWAEPVDKVVNWRFDQLVAAGYDFGAALELAEKRQLDLHQAVKLANEHGAQVAYLKFF